MIWVYEMSPERITRQFYEGRGKLDERETPSFGISFSCLTPLLATLV